MSETSSDNTNPTNPEGKQNSDPTPGAVQTSSPTPAPTKEQVLGAIDTKAIADQVAKGIDIDAAIKRTLQETFSPKKEKEIDPALAYFAKDTTSFLKDFKEVIKDEVRAEAESEKAQIRASRPVMEEYTRKFPQLKAMEKSVKSEAANYMAEGDSMQDALKKALDNHVTMLESAGIKSRSPEDINREQSMFPPTGAGGYAAGPGGNKAPESLTDHTAAFIKQQKESREKYRKPKVA